MPYTCGHAPTFLLTRPLRDVTPENTSAATGSSFLLTRPLRDVTVFSPMYPSTVTPFLLTRPLRDVTPSVVRL